MVLQTFEPVLACGMPSKIISTGVYQCKIFEYGFQCVKGTVCHDVGYGDYKFVGHLMTQLYPMKDLATPGRRFRDSNQIISTYAIR